MTQLKAVPASPKDITTIAIPTSTFATYQAVGNREDLSEMIYRIDATDTPFMSGVEASAVNHEW
jgi:hypothetical protein